MTLRRLAEYLCLLTKLSKNKYPRISSSQLAKMMGLKSSQLRQDFHHFGGFGRPGHPYDTAYLEEELKKIYGLDKDLNALIIGATAMAEVLLQNPLLRELNISFQAIVDFDKDLYGTKFQGFEVQPPEKIGELLERHPVQIGIICTEQAEAALKLLVDNGICAIWNPTCNHLRPQEGCIIHNENISAGLLTLVYNYNRQNQ